MIQDVAPAHLKAVERAVVFEGEHMVGNREEVPLGCNQTPNVHGLSCERSRTKSHSSSSPLYPSFVMKSATSTEVLWHQSNREDLWGIR